MNKDTIHLAVDLESYDRIEIDFFPSKPITICEMSNFSAGLLSYGLGVCKHGDTFDLETGCRIALISALNRYEGMFPKAERRAIWNAFLQRFPASDRTLLRNQRAVDKLLAHVFGQMRFQMNPDDWFALRQITAGNGR